MKRKLMAKGLSALLITSVFLNMMPVSVSANEGGSVNSDAQWETPGGQTPLVLAHKSARKPRRCRTALPGEVHKKP